MTGDNCIDIFEKIYEMLSVKKLKYLKIKSVPKHTIQVIVNTIFFTDPFCPSINKPAKYDTAVVNKIKMIYLGFQLI